MRRLLWLLLLTSPYCFARIVFSEIMFDPLGAERSDEFVEFYNSGATPIDLNGWSLADSLASDPLQPADGGTTILAPGSYVILFDSDYFADSSGFYAALIPPEARIWQIDGVTFGSGGLTNSRGKTLYLRDASGVDQAVYRYSANNAPGFSDEKIDLLADDTPANWGNSRTLHGTPGGANSLLLREVDIALTGLQQHDSLLLAGEKARFTLDVRNHGRQPLIALPLTLFYDHNRNSRPDPGEIARKDSLMLLLNRGDSLGVLIEFPLLPPGRQRFAVCAANAAEQDSSDNCVVLPLFVDAPLLFRPVINEMLVSPRSGYGEWIELVNNGGGELDLSAFMLQDNRDRVALTDSLRLLAPGALVVLAGDSQIISDYDLSAEQVLIISDFPSLNNDGDKLQLLGRSGWKYDEVSYLDSWYGREVAAGTSLEKLNPAFSGRLEQNWSASVAADGHTAGRQNSLFLEHLAPGSEVQIQPNPFSPDGDGVEDLTVIAYQLPVETAILALRVYDLRGRLIRTLEGGAAAAASGQWVWNGKDDSGREARIGAYICLLEGFNAQRRRTILTKKTIILTRR